MNVLTCLLGLGILLPMSAFGDSPARFLPEGELPKDGRLGPWKDFNGYFPFEPCKTPDEWAARSEAVRRRVLVAAGLWPMPTKTPLEAVIHGKVDREEYTVEKVYFQSFPGHFVTGSLYRPKGREGRRSAVLSPHGHWPKGRFYDAGEDEARTQIETGGEKSPIAARFTLQARCVHLARMGYVVFHYDMVGYADSVQLDHNPTVREKMNTAENWGYFSPQAESRLQNPLGLQTYNSIRALDFLSGLPDVDPKRIGVTGGSGGGTQTMILCAVDPRPAASLPAVMVSTAMQGGCTCENACYLRIGTGNVEFAALFAPKPLGMTAADDWTKEMQSKGFPELKQHYAMLGVEDRVMLHSRTEFPHNYNLPTRLAMYGWFNRHLGVDASESIEESDFRPLSREEMSVWNDGHPKPSGGDEHERALLRWMTDDSRRQMAALTPSNREELAKYREIVGGAIDTMIGRGLAAPGALKLSPGKENSFGEYGLITGLVRYADRGEELPIVALGPREHKKWNKNVVIWVDKQGKQSLFDDQGEPKPEVMRIMATGTAVIGVDLFGQGEFTDDGNPIAKTRPAKEGAYDEIDYNYAGFTFGYNDPVFARRVHDILTLVSLVKHHEEPAENVYLVGLDGAGHWVAAAMAQAGDAVDGAVIDTAGFRFADVTALDDPDFLPGGAKYGDLPGIIALAAPRPIWLAGEGAQTPALAAAAYRAAGEPNKITLYRGDEDEKESAAIEWLLRK